ncbi:MAG TPA: hypothetical protein VF179_09135 [Thermoanaerobaculia bacterium]|nr:hypothetical protein [Thermoanaerobaculia bacterium]
MTDAYSVLLTISVALAVASWLGIGVARWRRVPEWLHRLTFLLPLPALAFDGLAIAVHLAWGHRPGTDQAMSWSSFFAEHPAFAVVAFFSLVAWLFRPRQADRTSGRTRS